MLRVWIFVFVIGVASAQTATLERVGARGELNCGVSDLSPGVPLQTEDGGLAGFHTAFCRAVAAAVLGDASAVVYYPLTPSNRFLALRSGEVDMLVGNIEVNSSRDASFNFAPVVFHEGSQHYAPVLAAGDDAWLDAVTWVIYALIQAEEWGVTASNVALASSAESSAFKQFLGLEGDLVRRLGLSPNALRRAIEQVGNYGEIYARHLGPQASLSLPRGPNRLWTDGGLMMAPPFSLR